MSDSTQRDHGTSVPEMVAAHGGVATVNAGAKFRWVDWFERYDAQ